MDKRHGSAHLLFIYDENIKLLEACYVLLQEYRNQPWTKKYVTEEVLQSGKNNWRYFPDALSDDDLLEPYLVLKKIFKKTSLPFFREYLKDWTHAALYKHPDEILTPGEIVTVYEDILKLYAAAFIIHQTESANTILKRRDDPTEQISKEKILPFKTFPFTPDISDVKQVDWLPEISRLLNSLPTIRSITYLGSHSAPLTLFLLVLIDDNELTSELNLTNKLQRCTSRFKTFHIIVHKISTAINGLNNSIRFWHLALGRGADVFRTKLELPKAKAVTNDLNSSAKASIWMKWGAIGEVLFRGARACRDDKNFNQALFFLNQATEFMITGLIQLYLGYRPSGHNLRRNIALTLLFTSEIYELFQCNKEDGRERLLLLQSGYLKARYNPDFTIEENLLEGLFGLVGQLIGKAKLNFNA